jgi:RimJ/RimL family protein N-acetyltransferase
MPPIILHEARRSDFEALLSGRAPGDLALPEGVFEAPEVLAMLRDLADAIGQEFAPASWMIVDGREIVGLCSVVKAPSAGTIDIGYGITASRRKRGFAVAAVGAVLEWARNDERVDRVTAETSVHNIPSQRVLERNGFHRIGTRTDEEDGDLICWGIAAKT